MDRTINPLNHSLKDLKTRLTYKYFQFRIDTVSDPYRIRLRKTPYKILLILSHMRSGSSLLTHILNSNPEIIGYGETHIEYESVQNFKELMFKVYWRLKDLNMVHQYVMDKVLHDHKILDTNILKSENVTTIFLLREPKRTVSSILDIKPHLTEEKALEYYRQRLSTLEEYVKIIDNKQRSLLLTYDQLVNQSNLVFETLQNYLNTNHGFSEEYQVLKTTGTRGIGDSSENIKAGRIVQEVRKLKPKVSPEIEEKAEQVFEQCYQTLSTCCQYFQEGI